MKLLFVTHHRRSKTFARSEPWAREMVRRGHQVDLVCIAERERWRFRESEQEGVRIVETPDLLPGRLRSGWDPWDTLRRALWLRDRPYDLVHAFETRPTTIHPVLAYVARHHVRLAMDWNDWWGRGGLVRELRPGWYRMLFGALETWYEEHFRARAGLLTVISDALRDRARSLGVDASRIARIPGGVDVGLFRPTAPSAHRARWGIAPDAFVLGFGAADVTMDFDLALSAFAEVFRRVPAAMLLATGNRARHFDARLRSLGIGQRVRHLGFLPYGDLPSALSCADVFLLPLPDKPANRGRWPHKMGEYMAMGRPTVTNPTGEVLSLLRREAVGLLAQPTPADMAARILELRHAPELAGALGERARAVAVEQFAWPAIGAKLAAAYDGCFASADRHLPVS